MSSPLPYRELARPPLGTEDPGMRLQLVQTACKLVSRPWAQLDGGRGMEVGAQRSVVSRTPLAPPGHEFRAPKRESLRLPATQWTPLAYM